jgi:SWI/SNF-related matrix-associated actin-dependent regulator of chromatin subfamily A member 5
MGLGKTLQSISVLVYMLEYQNCTGPHLIVVPKSTLSNWMAELARWAPTIKPVKFHGDKAGREDLANTVLRPGQKDEDRSWHVCITTYEVCNIEKNVLNKFAWSYLIIDEAHRLKNEASAFSKIIRTFETRYRILLTGYVAIAQLTNQKLFCLLFCFCGYFSNLLALLAVLQNPASEFAP